MHLDGKQIDKGKDKHPDQVNKVPVKATHFDVFSAKTAPRNPKGHGGQVEDASCDVEHVDSRQAKESGAE